jgi:hypothetical protein
MQEDLSREIALFDGVLIYFNPFTGRKVNRTPRTKGVRPKSFVSDSEILLGFIKKDYGFVGEPLTRDFFLDSYGSLDGSFSTNWAPWAFSDRFGRFTTYLGEKGLIKKEGRGWVPIE